MMNIARSLLNINSKIDETLMISKEENISKDLHKERVKITFIDDDLDYELVKKKLSKPIYTIENKSGYILSLKDIKSINVSPYRHQRDSNKDHISKLKKGILETGYLYHPIILCHIPLRKEYSIIDGQHRYSALKEIEKTNKDIKVQIEVITLKEDDDSLIMDIYRNVNTCEPINMKHIIIEQDYVKFIQKVKTIYGKKSIVENKKKMKHYIIESDLKKELIGRNLLIKYSFDTLLKRIIEINDDIKEQVLELETLNEVEKERCTKTDFWLGCNSRWIEKL